MASTLAKMEISITKQVRAKRDAVTFMIVNRVNFHTVQQLQEELADFASFFPSTSWREEHDYLLLVIVQDKMRFVANNYHLDCRRIEKNKLVNPKITSDTKGRDLLKLQEDQPTLG